MAKTMTDERRRKIGRAMKKVWKKRREESANGASPKKTRTPRKSDATVDKIVAANTLVRLCASHDEAVSIIRAMGKGA